MGGCDCGHLGVKKSLPMQGDLEGLTSLFLRFKSVASPFPVSEIHWVEKANKTKDGQTWKSRITQVGELTLAIS